MKLRIEKSVYGGSGLAHATEAEGTFAGKTVFTPLTLPGELIEARVVEDKGNFLTAELAAVLEQSQLRTTPTCPYFGACGGCSYQHAVYAHQIEIKTAILQETLERARIPDLPTIHTLSGKPWHYRNRIRLHVQPTPFALCYRERRSNRLLPVSQCPIAAPLLEQAIATVTNIGSSLDLPDFCNEIEFFTNTEQSSLLISFLTEKPVSSPPSRLTSIGHALQNEIPQLTGTALFTSKGKQPTQILQTWGESSLRYQAAGISYHVGIESFFQVNRHLIDALVELVLSDRSGKLAWDLYAGVGLFSRALANRFERIIAVEAAPASFAGLERNLQTPHRALEATTHDFLAKQNPAKSSPDLVVVDPPRAGLGAPVTNLLAKLRPAEIVYVSCDPATLSRDLAALLQSGYDLQTIAMVDMFPQTFHLESVSVLARR
jgi:23S rRNA (uracil1939-C5)-methyltransferase